MMTKVAVVILNYNGEKFLEQFLPNVLKYSEEAETIVIDNASTDNSREILKANFPQVRTILLEENLGFAGGYNKGLQQIEAEYYVLLNSDVEVTENWISPVTHFLDDHPNYVAAQPKVLSYHNKEYFEYAGASGGFIDSLGYPYCRGRLFDVLEKDSGQYNNPIDIFWATGACMFIRSSIYHNLGGLDEDFFAHMEEIDLCWRIQSNKYKIKAIPNSVIYHVGGGTLSANSPFKTYLNFRNGIFLLIKNLPIYQLIWKIQLRFLLDIVAGIKFLSEKKGNHTKAIMKAHFHAISKARRMLSKRKQLSSPNNKFKSIIISFFLQKKQKYSKL